jgi:hypothetical protein
MRSNNVRNGASQGLMFQVQPQTTTNAGGEKNFIIPNGLAQSSSSGSLAIIEGVSFQGMTDKMKAALSFNTSIDNS